MPISKLWFRLLGLSFGAALVAAACGGTGFSAKDEPGDGGGAEGGMAGTAGTSGTAGTGAVAGTGGGTTLCTDALDCDDGKACTLDICNDVGQCEHPPKCTGDEPACCAGVCGQCCAQTDCEDGVDCTADDCFAGFCSHTPTACDPPELRYCSPTEDCKDREMCTTEAQCDDGDPCTTDTCADGLCDHVACAAGTHCCPEVGCATCCSDSQCSSGSTNLCSPSVCVNGECVEEDLCQGTNQMCCERGGVSADCGVGCCTDDDCENRLCTRKLCTPTGCRWDPFNDCPIGYHCDPDDGCVPTGMCGPSNPCPPPDDPCLQVVCTNGQCDYRSACSNGTVCCPGVGCRECCSSTECTSGADFGRPYCCPDGRCGECCVGTDCGPRTAYPKIITGSGPMVTIGGGGDCTSYTCNPSTHTCEAGVTIVCPDGQICCQGACRTQTQCEAI